MSEESKRVIALIKELNELSSNDIDVDYCLLGTYKDEEADANMGVALISGHDKALVESFVRGMKSYPKLALLLMEAFQMFSEIISRGDLTFKGETDINNALNNVCDSVSGKLFDQMTSQKED